MIISSMDPYMHKNGSDFPSWLVKETEKKGSIFIGRTTKREGGKGCTTKKKDLLLKLKKKIITKLPLSARG